MLAILRDVAGVMRQIRSYPLYRTPLERGRAAGRFLAWQVLGRMRSGALEMPFVGGSRLLVKRRLGGRLHYVLGLAEFDDMAFVGHLLRRDEVFADVGANIGVYSIMAAVAGGARGVAFEPAERAYHYLRENLTLNRLEGRIETFRCAVGAEAGRLALTAGQGEINHVLRAGEDAEAVQVDVVSLDRFFDGRTPPTLVKVDVEGFETEVVRGMRGLLAAGTPLAVLMELAGMGEKYGYDERALRAELEGHGYTACAYDALGRKLAPLEGDASGSSNILFVRDLAEARRRLREAEAFTLGTYKV